MKKLYWLIMSLISPACNDEYTKYGEGEYLARHGVANEIDDTVKTMQGLPVVKLDKHLQKL